MNCPNCGSNKYCKDGFVKGRQRYKCKAGSCPTRYSVDTNPNRKPLEVKRMALIMYLGGLTYREIGKELAVSYSTVAGWVNDMGENFALIKAPKNVFSIANAEVQIDFLKEKNNKEDKFILLGIRNSLSFF